MIAQNVAIAIALLLFVFAWVEPFCLSHRPSRLRRVDQRWWLLTQDKTYGPGPAYRIEGDRARAIPDETTHVVDVHYFAGATWLVTRRDGKAGPLVQVD